jgi:hypothetical protein
MKSGYQLIVILALSLIFSGLVLATPVYTNTQHVLSTGITPGGLNVSNKTTTTKTNTTSNSSNNNTTTSNPNANSTVIKTNTTKTNTTSTNTNTNTTTTATNSTNNNTSNSNNTTNTNTNTQTTTDQSSSSSSGSRGGGGGGGGGSSVKKKVINNTNSTAPAIKTIDQPRVIDVKNESLNDNNSLGSITGNANKVENKGNPLISIMVISVIVIIGIAGFIFYKMKYK